MRESPALPLL
jgi:hypothetical protein